MTAQRKSFNPFYAILVVVGVAFTVTACAYGVMTVRDMRATEPTPPDAPGEAFMTLLRQRGAVILLAEIGVLAVASVAAMLTDDYWRRRAERGGADEPARPSTKSAAGPAPDSPSEPRKDAS